MRTIVSAGAQTIFSITRLGGQGGPADDAGQIKKQSASVKIKDLIPVCHDSAILILNLWLLIFLNRRLSLMNADIKSYFLNSKSKTENCKL
jgi:hypothetical protein